MMFYIKIWGAGGTNIGTVSAYTQRFLSEVYLKCSNLPVLQSFVHHNRDYPIYSVDSSRQIKTVKDMMKALPKPKIPAINRVRRVRRVR